MSCDSYIIFKKVLDCLECNQSIVVVIVVNYLIGMCHWLSNWHVMYILNVSLVHLQFIFCESAYFKLIF